MSTDTTIKKAPPSKPGFTLPPSRKPQTAEEFIAAAGKAPADVLAVPAAAAVATSVDESLLPWEGQDDALRRAQQPYRLTAKEAASLDFILKNKPGMRSRHAYVLEALLIALRRDVKTLTGEDIEFAALPGEK